MACPVGAMGVVERNAARFRQAKTSFPQELESGVFYNGFKAEKSFGATSYFIHRPDGNWLVGSPRYLKHLGESFEK